MSSPSPLKAADAGGGYHSPALTSRRSMSAAGGDASFQLSPSLSHVEALLQAAHLQQTRRIRTLHHLKRQAEAAAAAQAELEAKQTVKAEGRRRAVAEARAAAQARAAQAAEAEARQRQAVAKQRAAAGEERAFMEAKVAALEARQAAIAKQRELTFEFSRLQGARLTMRHDQIRSNQEAQEAARSARLARKAAAAAEHASAREELQRIHEARLLACCCCCCFCWPAARACGGRLRRAFHR